MWRERSVVRVLVAVFVPVLILGTLVHVLLISQFLALFLSSMFLQILNYGRKPSNDKVTCRYVCDYRN